LKKSIFLIAGIVLLTFGNSLTNEFIGDTKSIYDQNSFYKHPANLTRFFRRDFIMSPEQFVPHLNVESSFSGCISYRPVTALSFLVDYQLFRGVPFWHHLSNLAYHFVACLLVYFFARSLALTDAVSLLSALIFAVHPIQAEVVNNIGYRSDILAVIFSLLTLLAYQRYRGSVPGRSSKKWLALSSVCLLLGLLSKGSALVLPALIFLFEYFFVRPSKRKSSEHALFAPIVAYFGVTVFYGYLYVLVFPSAHYSRFFFDGQSVVMQGLLALKIFSEYLQGILLPLSVKILPPLYTPLVARQDLFPILVTGLIILASVAAAFYSFRRNVVITFGIIWFYLAYLPAAHIVALPNPLAYRFLYLPMVGLAIVVGILLERFGRWLSRRNASGAWAKIIQIAVFATLISATIPINAFFKNNLSACKEMIRRFPDSSRPYWILGLTYYDRAQFDQAAFYFKKYQQSAPRNPFVPDVQKNALVHHFLGRCYANDPDQAIAEFRQAIQYQPNYVLAYLDMAKAYLLKSDFKEALRYAREAVRLDDKAVLAYVYAAHSCVELKDFVQAEEWLTRVKKIAPRDPNIIFAENFLLQRRVR